MVTTIYCVVAHGAIPRTRTTDPLIGDQIAVNYRKADITDPALRSVIGLSGATLDRSLPRDGPSVTSEANIRTIHV